MSKLYNYSIDVSYDQDGGPRSFVCRRHVYLVSGYTVEKALDDSFSFKRYLGPDRYTVETRLGLICELLKSQDGMWMLERVWD